MKTWNQLNVSQKRIAIKKVADNIKTLVKEGVLTSNIKMDKKFVTEAATIAASTAFFPEEGDEIMYDVLSKDPNRDD